MSNIIDEHSIKKGDRVIWSYLCRLNCKSTTLIIKKGTYIGKIRHTSRYFGPQLAYVEFDGNKRISRVPFYDLVLEKDCNLCLEK